MIDTNKIEIEAIQNCAIDAYKVIATLEMHTGITVTRTFIQKHHNLEDALKELRRHLVKEIWHHVYGDLFNPVMEISSYALKNCQPVECHRIYELHEQINKLFAGDTSPSKTAATTDRERYWLAMLQVLQPLDYDAAPSFILMAARQAGPVPNDMSPTVQNLLTEKLNRKNEE